jgi:GNAT superfamily N-acetyltransferase
MGDDEAPARGRAWRHATHTAICDAIEPWEHGTVVRASRYPTYYDFNLVRVERDPGMSASELIAFADVALAGLDHRRFDFEAIEAGDRLRADFEAAGWKAVRLLWMRHEAAPPPGPAVEVEEVPYDAVHALRVRWHQEDFPEVNPASYHASAREVALTRGAQVLAVRDPGSGDPIAFAQLERDAGSAEITQVYVHPDHRGGGRGTAMTRAAIEAASGAEDLWIAADDEDRPKELYARLGFIPIWRAMEVTLWP